MLGVSGGTYAALNALKTHFEGTLNDGNASCESQLQKVREKHAEDSTVFKYCRAKKKIIKLMYLLWRICHVIPALVFFAIVAIIWNAALRDWVAISTTHPDPTIPPAWQQLSPWKYSYAFLYILGITGFSCMGVAMAAWLTCYLSKRGLKLHHDGVVEQLTAEAKKTEAEKIAPV